MDKLYIGLFLISFWLVLPFIMQIIGVETLGYDRIDSLNVKQSLDWKDYIIIWFKLLTFSIEGIPITLKIFLNILQMMTTLFVLIMIRGN